MNKTDNKELTNFKMNCDFEAFKFSLKIYFLFKGKLEITICKKIQ